MSTKKRVDDPIGYRALLLRNHIRSAADHLNLAVQLMKPRAPLTTDRRTGGAHTVKRKTTQARKAKHKGKVSLRDVGGDPRDPDWSQQ